MMKRKMMASANGGLGYLAYNDRVNIIDMFSNYLTLNELENGVVKNKILNRFIVR